MPPGIGYPNSLVNPLGGGLRFQNPLFEDPFQRLMQFFSQYAQNKNPPPGNTLPPVPGNGNPPGKTNVPPVNTKPPPNTLPPVPGNGNPPPPTQQTAPPPHFLDIYPYASFQRPVYTTVQDQINNFLSSGLPYYQGRGFDPLAPFIDPNYNPNAIRGSVYDIPMPSTTSTTTTTPYIRPPEPNDPRTTPYGGR